MARIWEWALISRPWQAITTSPESSLASCRAASRAIAVAVAEVIVS